jgi:hypothetical protein
MSVSLAEASSPSMARPSGRYDREAARAEQSGVYKQATQRRQRVADGLHGALHSIAILNKIGDRTYDIKVKDHLATLQAEEERLFTPVVGAAKTVRQSRLHVAGTSERRVESRNPSFRPRSASKPVNVVVPRVVGLPPRYYRDGAVTPRRSHTPTVTPRFLEGRGDGQKFDPANSARWRIANEQTSRDSRLVGPKHVGTAKHGVRDPPKAQWAYQPPGGKKVGRDFVPRCAEDVTALQLARR